jgi:hypothetical protein
MGDAILLMGLVYLPFAIVLTVYFVKLVRRVSSLTEVLQREAECRIRANYELPPPTDPIIGLTYEQLVARVEQLERARRYSG